LTPGWQQQRQHHRQQQQGAALPQHAAQPAASRQVQHVELLLGLLRVMAGLLHQALLLQAAAAGCVSNLLTRMLLRAWHHLCGRRAASQTLL
jgi:hypothetical protein